MNGRNWLGKRVRVFPGHDDRKQYAPMAEGEVIGYIDGPSVIVRQVDGSTDAWPVSLPIEAIPRPTIEDAEASGDANGFLRLVAQIQMQLARDYDTAFDLISNAADDNELWEGIAVAIQEARNEGHCEGPK